MILKWVIVLRKVGVLIQMGEDRSSQEGICCLEFVRTLSLSQERLMPSVPTGFVNIFRNKLKTFLTFVLLSVYLRVTPTKLGERLTSVLMHRIIDFSCFIRFSMQVDVTDLDLTGRAVCC
jgi:hypothetical protein